MSELKLRPPKLRPFSACCKGASHKACRVFQQPGKPRFFSSCYYVRQAGTEVLFSRPNVLVRFREGTAWRPFKEGENGQPGRKSHGSQSSGVCAQLECAAEIRASVRAGARSLRQAIRVRVAGTGGVGAGRRADRSGAGHLGFPASAGWRTHRIDARRAQFCRPSECRRGGQHLLLSRDEAGWLCPFGEDVHRDRVAGQRVDGAPGKAFRQGRSSGSPRQRDSFRCPGRGRVRVRGTEARARRGRWAKRICKACCGW